MSAERQAAYSQLIEQLFTCEDEQALIAVVQANRERLDEGLLQVIQQNIASYLEQGDNARATALFALGEELSQVLEQERRLQLYRAITQALLNSPEADIQAYLEHLHRHFVDVGLLVFLQQESEYYRQTGELTLAEQYQQLIDLIQPPYIAAQTFLGELLYQTPDAITRFLVEHLPQINKHLLAMMPYGTAGWLHRNNISSEVLAVGFFQLGNSLQQFPLGERQLNIELAISSYQQALQVFTRDTRPVKWAKVMGNLAAAYRVRIRGDHADNLERAIYISQQALQVFTRDTMPVDWALARINLANAYGERVRGDKADNLERSIEHYLHALQVLTRDTMPVDWAKNMGNLAAAYRLRIRGDHADNLERSIDALQHALQVFTRDTMPVDWALAMMSLANAYRERVRGDKAENLERSIEHYQHALQVLTRDTMPFQWATTLMNWGMTYQERIRGDKADNLERSIDALQHALQVFTRDTMPVDWALAMMSLANAYGERVRGDKADNLERSIDASQHALQVLTRDAMPVDWARTMRSLAAAYRLRIRGDKADNLERSIDASQHALQVLTRDAMPVDWARTMGNLAIAYGERIRGDKADNLERSIDASQQALEILQPVSFPLDCLRIGRFLGALGTENSDWQTAIQGYQPAAKAIEQLLVWGTHADRKQEIQEDARDVYPRLSQAYVNTGQLSLALATAERSRDHRIAELMTSKQSFDPGNLPLEIDELSKKYVALQRQIDHQRHDLVLAGQHGERLLSQHGRLAAWAASPEIADLEQQQIQLLQALDQAVAKVIQAERGDSEEVQHAVNQQTDFRELLANHPDTAVLSFFTTETDTYVFVVTQAAIRYQRCPGQGVEQLQGWLFEAWIKPYIQLNYDLVSQPNSEGQDIQYWQPIALVGEALARERHQRLAQWITTQATVLQELAQRLQLDTLIQHDDLDEIEELILVPHLYLNQIPFSALPLTIEPSQPEYLGDRFRLRQVSSLRMLGLCQNRPREQVDNQSCGLVADTHDNLPASTWEGQTVSEHFAIPADLQLWGSEQATKARVEALLRQCQRVYFSHHAQARGDNPYSSGLELANGERLTVGELLTPLWRLDALEEVMLSCCETGLHTTRSYIDEPISLATAFLCVGARGVISSLWSVEDFSTALFTKFYSQCRQKYDRPTALQEAQRQLRMLSKQALQVILDDEGVLDFFDQQMAAIANARRQLTEQRNQYPRDSEAYKTIQAQCAALLKRQDRFDNLRTSLERITSPGGPQYPFAAPYYWAAFTCQGLRD
jgi:CHAT domain-containing protein